MPSKRSLVRVVSWLIIIHVVLFVLYLLYGLLVDDDPFNLGPHE